MKTAAELNALKEDAEPLNKKLTALSDEELTQVSGGEGEYDYFTSPVVTTCSCGTEITLNSEMCMNSGAMEIQCPKCGKWYHEMSYNFWIPIG